MEHRKSLSVKKGPGPKKSLAPNASNLPPPAISSIGSIAKSTVNAAGISYFYKIVSLKKM